MQYLITPAQRLMRYHLLLSELLKNLEPGMNDYIIIQSALSQTKQVADAVDKSVAEWESRVKILEIREEVSGLDGKLTLVMPHRKFVASYSDVKWLRESSKKEHQFKPIRLIIFSDMLLVCRRGKYKTHFMFTEEPVPWPDKNSKCIVPALLHLETETDTGVRSPLTVGNNTNQGNGSLFSASSSTRNCMLDFVTKDELVTFLASSQQQRDDIFDKIQTQLDNVQLNSPFVNSANKADPLRQRPALSVKMLRRRFTFRKPTNQYAKMFGDDRDSVSPEVHNTNLPEMSNSHRSPIVGLDLSGLSTSVKPSPMNFTPSKSLDTFSSARELAVALDSFFDAAAPIPQPIVTGDKEPHRAEVPHYHNNPYLTPEDLNC